MTGQRSRLVAQYGESVWCYAEPFVISRGVILDCEAFELCLVDEHGRAGRAEVLGVTYAGETPATMREQVEGVAERIASGVTRHELLSTLR